mgnify:CR=1 FL=1
MDFLGNIFLGIRIFDWIVLFFLLTVSARVFGVRDSLYFLETKVSELWVKLVHNKEYKEKPHYVPFSDTVSDTDEIIPASDKKEEPKKEKKKSTFIGTTFKILFVIVGFIVIVGIVNTYK